jgi:hypothetical protein
MITGKHPDGESSFHQALSVLQGRPGAAKLPEICKSLLIEFVVSPEHPPGSQGSDTKGGLAVADLNIQADVPCPGLGNLYHRKLLALATALRSEQTGEISCFVCHFKATSRKARFHVEDMT